MEHPIILGGRTFTPELVGELHRYLEAEPAPSSRGLAKIVCHRLAWYSSNGQLAISSAEAAVRKLRERGLLPKVTARPAPTGAGRLKASGEPLPPVCGVPKRVDAVRGLHLYLLRDRKDPHHHLWNDLIIQQHPRGDVQLAGPRLRYLIGSEHGWLGAISVGPAAFMLGAREAWVGWSPTARTSNLRHVLGLSRFLIRTEVQCAHLASKVLGLLVVRLRGDWPAQYAVEPLLLETFVERARFSGVCFGAANWQRIGVSTGRGRLGPQPAVCTPKDIWVYPLQAEARRRLQHESPAPLRPCPLLESLGRAGGLAQELAKLKLGDSRLTRRAQAILAARFAQPHASFFGSFTSWAEAKGAYGFIGQKAPSLSFSTVLAAHADATLERMAAEALVLLPQDTTTLNYTGLKQTSGLGPLGEAKGRGLWLHSMLAVRPDGVPLGVLGARCWARPEGVAARPSLGRNAKSIDEKESGRWVEMLRHAAAAARQMPQTQLVLMADREGDLYELYDAVQIGPSNLHTLVRAAHNRVLEDHQKLWAYMAAQPCAETRTLSLPRRQAQPARQAEVEIRFCSIVIEAPKVGAKKGWPSLSLHALWVHEPHPPAGVEPLSWMLLSDLPTTSVQEAWQRVKWYQGRWGIEEWHRVLKTGCNVEGREFKTAEHLTRALAFDLIVAWRVLACLKLGRAVPTLPASVLYTPDEIEVLRTVLKKSPP